MNPKIIPVKLDQHGHVIAAGSATRVATWRVTLGKKVTGGKKQRKFFSSEREAKNWLNEKILERQKKGESAFTISDSLRLEALECKKRLESSETTLSQAVDYYLRHASPSGGKKTFEEVTQEFLASRRSISCKPRTMTQYHSYLKVINAEWGNELIHQIRQADIEDWLSESEWAPRTRKNYIVTLTTVFNFGISREYCISNAAAKIPRPLLEDRPPGILTPFEAKNLLESSIARAPELTDALAVGLFAGLRRSELCTLDWREIKLASRFIEIKAGKAKTRKRRLVRISANLAMWLERNPQKSGPVAYRGSIGNRKPINADTFGDQLKSLARGRPKAIDASEFPTVKSPWPHNAIRHSFGSYFYAKTKNENETAAEMGNSPQMVFAHYRELVAPEEVERYWDIVPP